MTRSREDVRRCGATARIETICGRRVVVNSYSGCIIATDVEEWRELTSRPGHCTDCGSILRASPHHGDCPRHSRGAVL